MKLYTPHTISFKSSGGAKIAHSSAKVHTPKMAKAVHFKAPKVSKAKIKI